jgi:hypothetical protein
MYKARGQPGCWFGYAEIDGVTYKIDAKHVGERQNKHFEGTIKRHLKADQRKLPLGNAGSNPASAGGVQRDAGGTGTGVLTVTPTPPDFDDDLPF